MFSDICYEIMHSMQQRKTLFQKYPPSAPCSCKVCLAYCMRPGWWTVSQAGKAMEAGLAKRMMLELSPDKSYGVLSPAFKGNEGACALQIFAESGCTFLKENRCELHGTSLMPLECRFCHHSRKGQGIKCHNDIAKDWNTKAGKELVEKWCEMVQLRNRINTFGL